MPLNVLYKSVFVIDYENQVVETRDIPENFNNYINRLTIDLNNNQNIRGYKIRSANTEVYSTCLQSVNLIRNYEQNLAEIDSNSRNIAQRLLRTEIDVQARIERLGNNVQKGCLIQSLLYDEDNDQFIYLLAKVEHTTFFDDFDFSERTGFSKDQRKLWKSCVVNFIINENGGYESEGIKIYLQHKSDYWNNQFLEFDPMNEDEDNTKKAFQYIESVLKKNIKEKSPADYAVLSNMLIGHMRNTPHFDYEVLVTEVFREYPPMSVLQDDYSHFLTRLDSLPEIKKFDRQFNVIPGMINGKIKKIYKINTNIELKLNDYVNNLRELIKSEEDGNGNRFLKIMTDDLETFEAFK